MRVISEYGSNMPQALSPGSVVFTPGELRPWVSQYIAGIIRKLHARLPWFIRRLVSAEKLIELALEAIAREAVPGSGSVRFTPEEL